MSAFQAGKRLMHYSKFDGPEAEKPLRGSLCEI
jgi:hypothetical protein